MGIMEKKWKLLFVVKDFKCVPFMFVTLRFGSQIPLSSYVAGRVIAWLRAFHHCLRCETASNAKYATFRQSGKDIRAELVGGVALRIDLSQAFDVVPMDLMIRALLDAGIPHAQCCLLYEWHRDSVCHLRHGGQEAGIISRRGVGQGCVISPFIFACITGYLAKVLD